MKYIIAIGIFQALLAVVLLLRSRYRNSADDLLISLVVCIGLHLSIKFYIFNFVKDQEVLYMLNTFIGFSYIPLLYLYTLKTIRPEFIVSSRWYLFVPFMLSSIGYFSTICVLASGSPNGHLFLYWYNTITVYLLLSSDIVFASGIIYFALHKLPATSSERKLIVQIASLLLVIGILAAFFTLFISSLPWFSYLSRSIIYTLFIGIVIRIIMHKYKFSIDPFLSNTEEKIIIAGLNYSTADINDEVDLVTDKTNILPAQLTAGRIMVTKKEPSKIQKRKEILRESEMFKVLLKLETAMEKEKYYTDSELTLDKLSKLTDQNKYHISETLNHFVNKPFYTFVNEYRIKHVKERLQHLSRNSDTINILELAYEAGFNSKSSFNRYFKEITSNTPTEYLNLINKELAVEV